MRNTLDQALTRAYEYIEQDNLDAARTILEPYLTTHTENADLWWVYSHAVEDPPRAHEALRRVLSIDPNYPGAQELLHSLETETPPVPSSIPSFPAQPASQRPGTTVPDLPSEPEPLPMPPLEEEPEWLRDSWEEDDAIPESATMIGTETSAEDDWFDDWEEATPAVKEPLKASDTADDGDWLDDDWDDSETATTTEESEEKPPSRRRLLVPLGLLALVILVTIAVIVMVTSRPSQPTPTATTSQSVAQAPTATVSESVALAASTNTTSPSATQLAPTAETVEATPTQEIAATPLSTEETATGPDIAQLRSALAAFNIPEDGITTEETDMGQTLIVTVCGGRGELGNAMQALAQQVSTTDETVSAVAIRIGDCESPTTMRTVGVRLESAVSFANGTITLQEFQRTWTPIA